MKRYIKIGTKKIGKTHPVFIIAEAGVNHNGSLKLAKKMADVAKSAGADAIKFQTFKAESIVSRYAPKADYQKATTDKNESHFEMIKRLALSRKDHEELFKYCKEKKIVFLSSPFDLDSIELLTELGLEIFKIPSGEITNLPYLKKMGALNKRIIMSTGMADLKEIKKAISILTAAGTKKQNITIVHCNTAYPASVADVNLKAMLAIKKALNVDVGYSDHTLGVEISIAAAALGASVIEKHFTLDRHMKGPDHRASIEPDELRAMVKGIRNVEKALGDGIKRPSLKEEKIKKIVRKSIVAKVDIPQGTRIREDMLDIKRPGTGISPLFLRRVIGKMTRMNIAKDRLIKFKDLV